MTEFMNSPITDGHAYLQYDYKQLRSFVHCPYCGKKNFPVDDDTRIANLRFKCRGSSCKKVFTVNI